MVFSFFSDENISYAQRQKSTVLLIINNMANSKHDKKLTEIIKEALHKKIDNLYQQENVALFSKNFLGADNSQLSVQDIISKIEGTSSDYLIYAELKSLRNDTEYNIIYYTKKITLTFFIRIVDVKNKKDLYYDDFQITATDTTDYFFVGSGSVAKKALDGVLFKAGEIISCYLPL